MMMRPSWAGCFASVLLLAACGGDTDLIVSPLRPGSGQGSGSGSGSGSGTGSGTGCSALAQCCAISVPAEAQAQCDAVTASGDVSECDTILAELAQAGYCTSGSGTGTGTGTGTGECAKLSQCCSLLPPDVSAECVTLAEEDNESTCAAAYTDFESVGYCSTVSPPESPDCAQLSGCCSSLPETAQGECETIARADDDTQCTTALDELAQAGFCVGGGGIHPGG